MRILVLNGSPRRQGVVAQLLKAVAQGVGEEAQVDWVDVADLEMKFCLGCMKCRETKRCILPEDDAHRIGEKIRQADRLIVGTPVYWGNMTAQLKTVFDRNVPILMGEKPNGIPTPLHKGKKAVMVTACTTPWPFNFLAAESRGALAAMGEVLHYAGYSIVGKVVKAGSKANPVLLSGLLKKARKLGEKLTAK